jgi:hypothetical protein
VVGASGERATVLTAPSGTPVPSWLTPLVAGNYTGTVWGRPASGGVNRERKQESTTTLVNTGKTVDGRFRGEEDIELEAVAAGKAKIHCPGDIQRDWLWSGINFRNGPRDHATGRICGYTLFG